MICPLADGGAAAIIVSERKAKRLGIQQPVRVVSSVVHSFFHHPDGAAENVTSLSIADAYADAGVGPQDLSLVELHDSSAVTEMLTYEHLGLCTPEEAGRCVEEGVFRLGGRTPVNTSGGLLRKGHPVGATGVAQPRRADLAIAGPGRPAPSAGSQDRSGPQWRRQSGQRYGGDERHHCDALMEAVETPAAFNPMIIPHLIALNIPAAVEPGYPDLRAFRIVDAQPNISRSRK